MTPRNRLLLPILLLPACGGSTSVEQAETPSPEAAVEENRPAQDEEPAAAVNIRGLFYMERALVDGGVKGWPISDDGAEPVGPGEQAWLEVHSNGASHAYAFALFADGRILSLWNEKIDETEHTPPMNAFGDGLGLSADYDRGARLLVVASREPIAGVDEMGDCSEAKPVCETLRQINQQEVVPKRGAQRVVLMKQGELRVPAYGEMAQGQSRAAIRFDFMDAGEGSAPE